ncbi:transcriptional regulator [Actinosynnema sp. ALI-1.44]|uniref:Lrp/AsnC family transcriptional regulator n=1 Tax=Actinosynnema sp. ALI-1.44 TaxID=1933779 RepID=UPI00097C0A11|nr:Lrp/AsnC family transcriptional regulator [Actinosynnema sp. ALI-1.44]ONI84114.1 transcriptional regulator [Actinosynnema sp. ALI-1.44]
MHALDDADLDLVAALQLAPRAPLNVVADVLGTSASTISRRMQRLREERLMRVISTVHWPLFLSGNPYVVWIRCEPGKVGEVAAAVRGVPEAQSILVTTGDADIHCTIYPLAGTDQRKLLTKTLPGIPGVASVQSHLVLRIARRAVSWRIDRLTDEQADVLGAYASPADADVGALTDAEFQTLRLLFDDGRVSAAEVARSLDVSRSTAHRLLQSLLDRGAARPRVEIEPAVLGHPITALLTFDVRPRHIPAALAALGAHRSGRLTVMTAGPASIIHHGVFRDEDDLATFVTDDVGKLDGVSGFTMCVALGVLRRQWIDRDHDVLLGQRRHEILGRQHRQTGH